MPDDLHNHSDEALLAEAARRLGFRTTTGHAADDAGARVATVHVGVPAVDIPDGLADLQHDSEAIRRLLEVNGQRPVSAGARSGKHSGRQAGRP